MTYFDQLKDARWQKKRLKIMERDMWLCQECHMPNRFLNVHHKFYLKRKKAWEYPDKMLETLCDSCHESRETAILGLWTALMNASTGDFIIWAKRIRNEHKSLKKKLKDAADSPLRPPMVLSPALIEGGMTAFQKADFQRMRDAVNGLVKLQEARDA